MHQSVVDHFVDFTAPLEGVCKNLYADVKGLLTTAIGCLVDPIQMALSLPWVMPDGSPASTNEIATQWRAVKSQPALKNYPALSKTVLAATTMRLTDEGVAQLVHSRLLANEKVMRGYFPNWDSWPADAQLFACSMAWAVGAGWPHIFGNCTKFLQAGDWANASLCAAIKTEGNPGIVPRNAQNRLCLANALAVTQQHLDPTTLFWPNVAHPDDQPVASQAKAELDINEARLAITMAQSAGLDALTGAALAGLDLSHSAESAAAYDPQPRDTEPSPPPNEHEMDDA